MRKAPLLARYDLGFPEVFSQAWRAVFQKGDFRPLRICGASATAEGSSTGP